MKKFTKLFLILSLSCTKNRLFKNNISKGGDVATLSNITLNSNFTDILVNESPKIVTQFDGVAFGNAYCINYKTVNTLNGKYNRFINCYNFETNKSILLDSVDISEYDIDFSAAFMQLENNKILSLGSNNLIVFSEIHELKNSQLTSLYKNGDTMPGSAGIGQINNNIFDFVSPITFVASLYTKYEDGLYSDKLRIFTTLNDEITELTKDAYDIQRIDGIRPRRIIYYNDVAVAIYLKEKDGKNAILANVYELENGMKIVKKLVSGVPMTDFNSVDQQIPINSINIDKLNNSSILFYTQSSTSDLDKNGIYAVLTKYSKKIGEELVKYDDINITDDTSYLAFDPTDGYKDFVIHKSLYVKDLKAHFIAYGIRSGRTNEGKHIRKIFVRAYREGIDNLVPLTNSMEIFYEINFNERELYFHYDSENKQLVFSHTCEIENGEETTTGICSTRVDVEVKKTFTSTTMKLTTTSSTTVPVTTTTVTDKITDPTTSTNTVTEQPTTITTKTVTEEDKTTTTTSTPVVTTTTTTIPKPVITTTTNKPTSTLEDPTTTSASVVVQPTFNGAVGDDSQQTITDGDNQNSGVDGATIGAAAGAASGAVLVLGGAGIIVAKRRQHGTIKPEMPENGRRPDLADYDIADTNTTTSTIVSYDNPDNSVEYAIPSPAQPIVPLTYFADNKKGQNSEIDRTYLTPVSSSSVRRSLVDKNPKSFTNLAYEGQSEKPGKVYYSELSEGDTAALYSTVQKGTKSKAPIINANLAETELYDMPKGPEEVYSTTEEQQKSGYEYLSSNDLYDVVADGTDDANISNIKLGDKKAGSVKLMTHNDGLYDMPKGPEGSETRIIEEEFNGFGEEEFGGFSDGYLSVNPDGTIKPATESSATNA